MHGWEEKRAREIKDYILNSQVISLLIFAMIIFSFYNLKLGENITNFSKGSIALFVLCIVVIVYVTRQILPKITLLNQAKIDEILLIGLIFPLTFAFLYFSKDFFGAKVLIVVPVMITATAFGSYWGTGGAVMASALLFFLDYLIFHRLPPDVFQTNLIVSSVTILSAWLIGGLMGVERKTQQELVKMADYDYLTGLYNHRYLQEKLASFLPETSPVAKNNPSSATPKKAAPGSGKLTLVLFDINQFKYYNTLWGYQKGDEFLAAMGKLLLDEVKNPAYVARYGGDEFILVLPETDKQAALPLAHDLIEKMTTAVTSCLPEEERAKCLKPLTISVGMAGYPVDGKAVLPLIRAAEDDLFRIKYSLDKAYLYKSVLSEISALKIKDAYPALQAFVALINARDRYTFGHSERVMSYAVALGEKLALSEEEIDILRYGAYLHDIGKIEIEASVLNKEGALDKAEWETMKKHPVWGNEIVQMMVALNEIGPVIRSHHENYDGSGYPDGLKEENIPFLARILRLADSFDAMITDRPYRKALEFSEACLELKRHAGTFYDPRLVKPFLVAVRGVYKKTS
jgi:diguanylate cyclase (GGDEF)-like protein/putative nucleotidyltransferase with HDIG domain